MRKKRSPLVHCWSVPVVAFLGTVVWVVTGRYDLATDTMWVAAVLSVAVIETGR